MASLRKTRRLRPCAAMLTLALAFASFLAGGGCASSPMGASAGATHVVKVNATAVEAPKKGTAFTLVAKRDSVDDSTLLYAEAARVVTSALQTKGMHAAPSVMKADVIVELDYGMAPPRIARRDAEPVVVEPPKPVRADVPTETNIANLRSAARGPLEKRLVLTAREARPPTDDAPPRTLWSVELTTIDLSNDIRKYFPLLASVALDQMGTDSGGAQLVRIGENDKTVTLLKKPQ